MVIVKWFQGFYSIVSLVLEPWQRKIRVLQETFININMQHISITFNVMVDYYLRDLLVLTPASCRLKNWLMIKWSLHIHILSFRLLSMFSDVSVAMFVFRSSFWTLISNPIMVFWKWPRFGLVFGLYTCTFLFLIEITKVCFFPWEPILRFNLISLLLYQHVWLLII